MEVAASQTPGSDLKEVYEMQLIVDMFVGKSTSSLEVKRLIYFSFLNFLFLEGRGFLGTDKILDHGW